MSQTTFIFNKERSVKACLANSWCFVALGVKRIVVLLWPYLLMAGVAHAISVELVTQYMCQHAMPAIICGMQGNSDAAKWLATPSVAMSAYLLLSVMFCIFSGLALIARTFSIVNYARAHNALPQHSRYALTHTDFATMKRVFFMTITVDAIAFIVNAALGYAAVKWSLWIMLVCLLANIYLLSFTTLSTLRYALFGKSFNESMKYGATHAFGITFIIMVLTAIPVTLCTSVASMPELIYVLATIGRSRSLLMGDTATLPFYMPLSGFLINTICHMIALCFATFYVWPLSMKLSTEKDTAKQPML